MFSETIQSEKVWLCSRTLLTLMLIISRVEGQWFYESF